MKQGTSVLEPVDLERLATVSGGQEASQPVTAQERSCNRIATFMREVSSSLERHRLARRWDQARASSRILRIAQADYVGQKCDEQPR